MAAKLREIDWESVEVQDGNVVVAFTGSPSKEWAEHFTAVLRLLAKGHGRWGEVSLTRKAIQVATVQPGAEGDLRHLLESVVAQVNAELRPDADEQSVAPEDPQAVADREMAETLRSFAEAAQE
jgi:hypothetical protein